MTFLASSIFVDSLIALDEALDRADLAVKAGAKLIEWRIDAIAVEDGAAKAVEELLRHCPVSSIVTCRPKWEGGLYDGDESDRMELLERIARLPQPPRYLDIEQKCAAKHVDMPERLASELTKAGSEGGVILSSHDLQGRPADLFRIIEAMTNTPGGSIIKVVWFARSLRDNLQAFELLAERQKPTIALCMGEFGLMSRVLASKFGGFLTFATVMPGRETAPGQPTIDDLRQLYRFDSIGRDTRVYGVIGWPVGHSLSPALHNAGFEAVGHDGVYLPLPIPPEYEHFKATVGAFLDFAPLHFRGASVTIPHKENLLRFVKERGGKVDPLAETIGAANTLTVNEDGTIEASNTDCPAAIQALCASLDIEFEGMAGKSVAMLGAGGAARGIVVGLAQIGANVTIFNRSRDRAEALAGEFGTLGSVSVGEAAQLSSQPFDIYINCTPLGMAGTETAELSPLPEDSPLKGALVMDTVYNPVETPLLKQAEAAGAKTLDGMAMFVRQAGAQFTIWTGQPLPVDAANIPPR